MKKLIALLVIIYFSTSHSQNEFQNFINYVNSLPNQTLKTAAVDSFIVYARTKGIPFITGDSANFIYRGNVSSVSVAGDFNSWNPSWNMVNLSQTNFWYYSRVFEPDARLDYKFVTNGSNWILDPENPKQVMGGFGPNSELAMPMYVQPWEINYRANIPHGTVVNKTIFSVNVNTTYQLRIYLPPDYDSASAKRYPTVYFQDGFEYISLGYAVNVIDNLIDSNKIQPVIAVFVRPNNRNDEYAGSKRNQYRLFFANELVPYIDSTFKTMKQADKRLVLGDSFGGNISAIISYNHPEIFGLCGLHSGAFWPNNYEIYNQIINGPYKSIKWCSIWGSYEGSLVTNMRSFRDFLQNNNYQLWWKELPEGHSWGLWRATLDDMLMFFFPNEPSSIKDKAEVLEGFQLYQNYPNPFNPTTKISWQSPVGSWQTLKVYDVLGKEVATLVDGYKEAGIHKIEFNIVETRRSVSLPSGVYFYQLKIGDYIQTKKMILVR
jgi:enterochelin esterase family protein